MDMKKITINKNWLSWFIGFCDAEANFQTFPKKRNYLLLNGKQSNYYNIGYGFHLSLSIKDQKLIQKIHKNLNYLGKIYEYKNRQEIRLAITRLKDLKWLCENIFEKYPLLTIHQRNQYSRLKYGVLNNFNRVETLEEYQKYISRSFINSTLPISIEIIPKTFNAKDTEFIDNWISGFINGEGSFTINKKGFLIFYIEQAENKVLNLIKQRLQLGPKIVFRKKRQIDFKDTYSLSVSSKKDIRSLINFFDNIFLVPLDGQKKKQFENWKTSYNSNKKYI